MTRVPVSPETLRWACERAGFDVARLAKRMPQLPAWVRRERQPTLKQLEKLAKLTHTPLGYLFLPEPPKERLPVPDYRTVAGTAQGTPSPDLLDTLYTMQRRQEWLREALVENDVAPTDLRGKCPLFRCAGSCGSRDATDARSLRRMGGGSGHLASRSERVASHDRATGRDGGDQWGRG